MRRQKRLPSRPPAVEVEVGEVAFGGDGVGRVDGRVWFVPFTLPGERVLARPVRGRKGYVRAEAAEILRASPYRVVPPCPYFGTCGGCSYQHIDYAEQLEIKRAQVVSLLRRIARIPAPDVSPAVPSEPCYAYRNRITVHIQNGVVGFHRADGKGLVEIAECKLAVEEVNRALSAFRGRRGLFDGHRTLRSGHSAEAGFRQTNDGVAAKLRDHVAGLLAGGGDVLVDAFCGSGFFGSAMREKFGRVIGIDRSGAAIAAARAAAAANERYLRAEVSEGLKKIAGELGGGRAALLLDPPSEGLDAATVEQILRGRFDPVVYVSCNPATFARDVARLAPGYTFVSAAPFDMFAQTAEIELAALLRAN